MKALLALLFFWFSFSAGAFLPPNEPAPLYDHLREINAHWSKNYHQTELETTIVHFNDEAERIRTHLLLVTEKLLQDIPEGFSAQQVNNRLDLLYELREYAMRGDFPVNTRHNERIPYFIDDFENYCAVGYLIKTSGFENLAQEVKRSSNQAYIEELPLEPLQEWGNEFGFSIEELKWIQPGYPPNTYWVAPGGGVNGEVKVTLSDGSMEGVIIAGSFTQAGDMDASGVARWNGVSFEQMGSIEGNPICGVLHDNVIYLGGSFNNGINDLAMWNGEEWIYQSVIGGMEPQVNALLSVDGQLIVAGKGSGIAGYSHVVLALVQDGISLLGQFDQEVFALGLHGNQIIAGGEFNEETIGGTPANFIAAYTGSGWENLPGLPGPVHAVGSVNNVLYAGGKLWDPVLDVTGLSSWNGESWDLLSEFLTPENTHIIKGIVPFVNNLIVYGDFATNFGTVGQDIAIFHTGTEAFEVLFTGNNLVNSIITAGNNIYAGGTFTENFNGALPYFAKMDLSSGVYEKEIHPFTIFPNPSESAINILTENFVYDQAKIFDISGKLIYQKGITPGENSHRIGIDFLSKGTYFIGLFHNGIMKSTRPFVKQ